MEIKVIGNQYSQYGSSTFYKGLRITIPSATKNGVASNKNSIKSVNDGFKDEQKEETESISNESKTFIVGMGDCIPVRPWTDSPIECLAEVRMIWRDKSEQSLLLSLRLFFLPENTPKGRISHGEDEVIAVKDLESPRGRIVIKAEDFTSWLVDNLQWNWGLTASFYEMPTTKLTSSNGIPATSLLSNSKLDFSEVDKEKDKDGNLHSNVTVLSYSRYCRYRAALKRLEHIEDDQVRVKLIETLSGFVASQPNTRMMFAKETIDYPDLESHEMLCPHLAPKLKGRPRGRRKKFTSRVSECCSSPAPSSEFSVESNETNDSDVFDGKHLLKNMDKNNQRLTRNKRKSESVQSEIYTTLSTGRVSKQRLPLTPMKAVTNKRKRKADMSDDDSSSDDDQEDEDYDDKYVNRKLKQENGSKRSHSSRDDSLHDEGVDLKSISHMLPTIQIPYDSSKSQEELDFLIRLNTFMSESLSYPKTAWGLRDVNLFTIYTRVQKLGGFNAIADNRVWKNLFEDLSEPGKCITQGMTKRKYERILLPFERYERKLRENGHHATSELTISTISKNSANRKYSQNHQNHLNQRHSSSPAIEIIPLKNEHVELTLEQINEIRNIIKPKDHDNHHFFNGNSNSNDGVSVPVHVIVRPTANGSSMNDKRKAFDADRLPGSSRSFMVGQQKPKEKENIPMMLQSTTIVPLNRDGVPAFASSNVVELVDSDEDTDMRKGPGGYQNMKKRKLDILREGGLEVTPISRQAQESLLMTYPHQNVPRANPQTMQPNVSLMSLSPVRAPPVIQSANMYQSTTQVFKNPKEDVINAARGSKSSYCLDLTSKKHQQQQQQQNQQQQPSDTSRKSQLSIEEVQRNYRGSNPDLQITLVKPHQESPSSSSSSMYNQKANSSQSQRNKSVPYKKSKNVPSSSQTLPGIPPLNPVIIAAANELQKLQQQNMPLFPFLSGLDVTPMHQSSSSSSGSMKNTSHNAPPMDPSNLMNYLSALYANPLLQGNNMNMLSNMSPAVEFMKLFNNSSSSSNNRIPSNKN